ncbi:hypothetical protein NDR87_31495 [Nocardia sp. CDC159]|uniref:Uncharacterized protein n=1 Tax=Nocardia pulmonis TaxID=2951408 RepID=A0A9X2J1B3_9NOCA|nr:MULTISPECIES: hypothetical protein [Nocardia]MCM6777925.1 hypothetical protein [Nocardia pulmonis]MCM6790904.1 hypothetical protein [Nocardia sp. CDC159]
MVEVYKPPLANPSGGGLYTAATIIDAGDPPRLAHGVVVDTWNCGPSWVWPIACEAEQPDPSPKGTEPRTDWLDTPFTGDVIGADDNCSALVPETEAAQRAQQLLRLHEPVRVEQQLTTRLLTAAGAPATVAGLVAAVGALEETVAEFGITGVLHAAPHLAAAVQAAQLVTRSGAYLVSPMGHRWAFGAGYADLGETIVATGPVTVHRGPVSMTHGPDYPHNARLSVAEREVLVSWECWTEAVTIGA